MARKGRIAALVYVLLVAAVAWAQQEPTAQQRVDRAVDNRSAQPAWITLRYPDLGPDASSSRCVAPGESARFVAEPGMRAVVQAETRPSAHCAGPASCKASTEWAGGEASMWFSSDGKSCALGVGRKLRGARPTANWGQLFVANESRTHALFVRVSPPQGARARDDEIACIRPGYSARFLVPPGEEENWKRGRYNRFVEAELRPLGSNCTLRTVCRGALEVEWYVPGERRVAMRTAEEGARNVRCQLEQVR